MIYYLLSKEDFATLYKFGEVNVKVGAAAESDNPREAVKRLFSASDSFEYAQERLIVSSEKGSQCVVRMVEVKDIFPLDDISRNLFKSQFNTSIIFREPTFQDIAEDFLKNTVLERTTISGIQALRAIFGLKPERDEELIGDIIKGKTFLRQYKYFDIPLNVRTPYSMLIAYNRYQHYPKDSRGFFYDAADCFMYGHMFRSLSEPEEFLGYDKEAVARYCSKFHGLLDRIPANTRFRDIAVTIEESNQRIKDAISQVYGSISFMALYLYTKERILADETVSLNGIKLLLYIQKEYPAEFPKLVTLLGGFLGYTWVYDRSYEFQDCPFLSVHHDLNTFLPMEPAVQSEVPQPEEPSPETQTTIQEMAVSEGNADEESFHHDATPQGKGAHGKPETATSQPDEEQPTVVPGSRSTDAYVGLSVNSKQTMGPIRNEDLDIDIPSIVKALFIRKSKRREAFEKALLDHHDEVLRLAKEKDDTSLMGLYLKLDKEFKPAKEPEKQDLFVKACFALKPPMFNE